MVNDDIYDKAVDRAAMVRLYERRVQGKIETVIDEHQNRTGELISKSSARDLRSPSFQKDLDLEVSTTYTIAKNTSARSLTDLVADQVSYMYQNLEAAAGRVYRIYRPEGRIAEEIVLERPLQKDTTLEQGWSRISKAERDRIVATIRRGLAQGLSVEEIARNVRSGNVFAISRAQSFGLVRTAITSIQAQADHEVYKINKGILVGYQYVAVLDSRTSDICAYRDGKIYEVGDVKNLPPAHWNCRSTTTPVVKKWDDIDKLEGLAAIRKKNLSELTDKQKAYYDGLTPARESYDEWLRRQPSEIQLRHLGNFQKLELFRSGQLKLDKFSNADGKSVGIRELRQMTDSGYAVPGTTARFALAKEKLDAIKLGANRPEDLYNNKELQANLREYFLLQNGDLDGTLSLMPYRGVTLAAKKNTKNRVLNIPPSESNLIFNPINNRYEDARILPPSHDALENSLRLTRESDKLKDVDKEFIENFSRSLEDYMGVNERAVIVDNLRANISRYRTDGQPWGNFKAVIQNQIKFDVMNISDFIETNLRRNQNLIKRLKQDNYFDPILGEVQLQELHDEFIDNIFKRNKWEDKVAPKIAKELRGTFDLDIPFKIRTRLSEADIEKFYKRFAGRLSMADNPDRDQLAISLGRDLYNSANYRGTRRQWYELGLKLIEAAKDKGFFEYEVQSTQKRRLKSRMFGGYVGPYYDTLSIVLRNTDKRIQEYSKLQRKIDVGLRIGVTTGKNRLMIRKGKKTYYDRWYRDTRIPITSTDSFPTFPEELITRDFEQALNWAAEVEFKVDPEFHDFIEKLLFFEDDKGRAQYYNSLNHFREYIIERGDAYERFKAMKWLRNSGKSFSNHPFLDHRGRIYERGMIGPQAGETFRPFLNTAEPKPLGTQGFYYMQDIIGSTLGGISDHFEGRYNSLSQIGRQKIAEKWRSEMIKIGNHIRRNKPNDIRAILESEFLAEVDGEEQAKVLRLALEIAKIDEYLGGKYDPVSLKRLDNYMIDIALEQDASSSGAQIIALTTRNKQLAELSNVVATDYKKRLYDEIAASTFNDPRFRELNQKLGLTEKDLRKAAKAQNMVTFYGAGEKTGILNVEGKLAKVLAKEEGRLVVKASERDTVLAEISARAARYRDTDPLMFEELMALRQDVRDIFNKGETPGDDIIQELSFLDPKTRDLVEKMSRNYTNRVTPQDFATIAKIMSENLRQQVPILKEFTKYFGRLAKAYAEEAKKPSIPWKTFDGKTIEQYFTQTFEERLVYKTADGRWINNFVQVAQKTNPTFFDELLNKDGKIRDITDLNKAITAFAVNGNHSNDAVIVRKFHNWGRDNNISTATVHDAFVTNAGDLIEAKKAIREIYADMLDNNPIEATLFEMLKRGLPLLTYIKFRNEAIQLGLIPKAGKSVIGGKVITEDDILKKEDIQEIVPEEFWKNDRGWYGIGG